MTEDDRRLNAKKYFIFKLIEYFRNSYGVLHNKKYDSLIAMCREIIDIQDEIYKSKIDTSHLQRSLASLLEGFKFQWTDHPLIKHKTLKKDIVSLVNRIKTERENEGDYYIVIYNSITGILKKLSKEIIVRLYVDVIKNENLTYGEVDKLLDSFVSELLFQGFSLKYLEEWYIEEIYRYIKNEDFNMAVIDGVLDKIGGLAFKDNKFYVLFACRLPFDLQRELEEQHEIRIKGLTIITGNTVIKEIKEKININENLKYLYTEVIAGDKYKAIEIIKNSIESYTEIYKILNQSLRTVINDKTAFYISEDERDWESIHLENVININHRITNLSKQEKEDIQTLIQLRKPWSGDELAKDLTIIERSLEITKYAMELTPGNKLLNVWSGLEYLSTFYYKDKIIERVRSIIPKVICLYFMKNKLNILWDRIKYYKYREKLSFIEDFLSQCCRDDNIAEYDIEKLCTYLSDLNRARELCRKFGFNIIIQREISELNGLLMNKEGLLLNSIKDVNELIKQDLNRIYRVRNKIVHSGSNIPENIDFFTFRLYKYVNALLGTLIYYIKRNPGLTITEILYSLVETYEWYIEFVSNIDADGINQNIKEIVFPSYLYL